MTRQEAELGQELANGRRDALMAAGESLVTASTFSHPSKLDLIRKAKGLGYQVLVHHVNVEGADFAVARVAAREARGAGIRRLRPISAAATSATNRLFARRCGWRTGRGCLTTACLGVLRAL